MYRMYLIIPIKETIPIPNNNISKLLTEAPITEAITMNKNIINVAFTPSMLSLVKSILYPQTNL